MSYFIDKENDWGNIEYKKHFINMTPDKIKKYATQLKFRIIEGNGVAIYIIGVADNGKIIGIKKGELEFCNYIMTQMCQEVNAEIQSQQVIDINSDYKLLIYVLKNNFNISDLPYLSG